MIIATYTCWALLLWDRVGSVVDSTVLLMLMDSAFVLQIDILDDICIMVHINLWLSSISGILCFIREPIYLV